ncbi:alpha/beta fold hydrolase [Nonomuraea sp. C10]|uniref:alpha/beta fold hydrolase n=1 Tax=Nonomuraea sp. C10 TaxID=2600577 RepID=UPI0011CE0C29|nr:alpha/beta hydrolase [Nonomuraea sp. C10]TXK34376.1 alpha/beta hydrolase [Nonomuraea sp. C10]
MIPSWFRDALAHPVDTGEVTVAGVPIRYRAWGAAGRPGIVFVHGGAAHSRWWDHIAPLYAGGHRAVALDLSGHGDSGHAPRYGHDTWAEQVLAVAADAGITGAPVLVGHSMGGLVCLRAALSYGPELGGVVSVDSVLREEADTPAHVARRQEALRRPRLYPTREEAVARFHPIPEVGRAHRFVVDHLAETSVRAVEGGWTWKFDPLLFGQPRLTMEELFPPDCPVALMRAGDGLPPPEMTAAMHRRLGVSLPVIEIADCGHHVMLDQPLPFVAALDGVFAGWGLSTTPAGRLTPRTDQEA